MQRGGNLNRYYTTKIYLTLGNILDSLHDRKAILEEFVARFSQDTNYIDGVNEAKNMLRIIR
jgi:hypothetical protein